MSKVRLHPALTAPGPRLGLVVMYPSAGVIERIGPDWDWVWIDGQHGEISEQQALELVRACDLIDRPALVRVPGHCYGAIGKALDTGAAGVIVPGVDTPAQAKAVVAAAKFPPVGNRSYGGRRPIDLAGRDYSDAANDDVLCVVQIESPEAVGNAAQIAAIPGVDALFLGHDDLMLRRGYGVHHPRDEAALGADMQAVAGACEANGKIAVMVGTSAEMITLGAEMGFKLIVCGGDVPFLVSGSKQAVLKARQALAGLQRVDGTDGQPTSPSRFAPIEAGES